MKDRYTLEFELRYALRLLDRQLAVYRLGRKINTAATLILGSGALVGVTQGSATLATLAGVFAAASGVVAHVLAWPENIAVNQSDRARYSKLFAERDSLSDVELEKRRDVLGEMDAPEIPWLRRVAYNDVACEIGRPEAGDPLNPWQRLIRSIA